MRPPCSAYVEVKQWQHSSRKPSCLTYHRAMTFESGLSFQSSLLEGQSAQRAKNNVKGPYSLFVLFPFLKNSGATALGQEFMCLLNFIQIIVK